MTASERCRKSVTAASLAVVEGLFGVRLGGSLIHFPDCFRVFGKPPAASLVAPMEGHFYSSTALIRL